MLRCVHKPGSSHGVHGTMVRKTMSGFFRCTQRHVQYRLMLAVWFFSVLLMAGFTVSAQAQTNGSLPVALTVEVTGVSNVPSGTLIVYDELSRTYAVARGRELPNVAGVSVDSPPLVFLTASNTVPIVTEGSAYLFVNNSSGEVVRGDLLVSSASAGVAAKATEEEDDVFAIALEDAPRGQTVARVLVSFDPERARAVLAQRRAQAEEEREAQEGLFGLLGGTTEDGEQAEEGLVKKIFDTYARGVIAALIAIGSLFFIMYTFRSTVTNATLSVGRNPRAKNAIMTVSIGNILFALLIVGVALFVAIAILVLPVAG